MRPQDEWLGIDSTAERLEALERRLDELGPRLEDEVLKLDRATHAEIDVLRDEMLQRAKLASAEAEATREAISQIASAQIESATQAAAAPRPAPARAGEPWAPEAELAGLADSVEARLRSIEDRVGEADRSVRELAGRHGTDAPFDQAEPRRTAEPQRLDLNRVGFEQLRDLGLTVTQAARVLARRDVRGEFSSIDQLDDLRDLSRELIERLKQSLRVD